MHGVARVLLCSSAGAAYPTPEDQRQRALQMLVSLPSLAARDRAEITGILNAAYSPAAWDEVGITVDGTRVPAAFFSLQTGEWCLTARAGQESIQLAAKASTPNEIEIRPIGDWDAYRVDMRQPQPAEAIADAASDVFPAWESSTH